MGGFNPQMMQQMFGQQQQPQGMQQNPFQQMYDSGRDAGHERRDVRASHEPVPDGRHDRLGPGRAAR